MYLWGRDKRDAKRALPRRKFSEILQGVICGLTRRKLYTIDPQLRAWLDAH